MKDYIYYNFYKPFRNKLRNVNPYTGLYVLWSYLENILRAKAVAPDIEVSPEFLTLDYNNKISIIGPWELETIAREILINAKEGIPEKYALREWNVLIMIVNKLKTLNNELEVKYGDRTNIYNELNRVSHQQFPWRSEKPSRKTIIRYYKIYSNPKLKNIIEEYFGFDLKKLYIISAAFYGSFLQKFSSRMSKLSSELTGISDLDIQNYLNIFSKKYIEIQELAISNFNLDETYPYLFNPLRSHPLVIINFRGEEYLCCPITYYFVWKFTSGIYYNLYNVPRFDNYIGESFQEYVYEVLMESNTNNNYKIYSEARYRARGNMHDQVDWLVEDKDSLIFLECKCKRPNLAMKISLQDSDIDSELKKIASMVFQVYRTMADWQNDLYINHRFDSSKQLFPVIVTLEEWYLWGEKSNSVIREELLRLLDIEGMDVTLVEKYPYTISSINSFETSIQLIDQKGIEGFLGLRNQNIQNKLMPLDQFINIYFNKEMSLTTDLFKEEFRRIFIYE